MASGGNYNPWSRFSQYQIYTQILYDQDMAYLPNTACNGYHDHLPLKKYGSYPQSPLSHYRHYPFGLMPTCPASPKEIIGMVSRYTIRAI